MWEWNEDTDLWVREKKRQELGRVDIRERPASWFTPRSVIGSRYMYVPDMLHSPRESHSLVESLLLHSVMSLYHTNQPSCPSNQGPCSLLILPKKSPKAIVIRYCWIYYFRWSVHLSGVLGWVLQIPTRVQRYTVSQRRSRSLLCLLLGN